MYENFGWNFTEVCSKVLDESSVQHVDVVTQ